MSDLYLPSMAFVAAMRLEREKLMKLVDAIDIVLGDNRKITYAPVCEHQIVQMGRCSQCGEDIGPQP